MKIQDDSKVAYVNIFKATSLFGGVQIFNIFIYLIRSKVIALLLGPTGMGTSSLLTSTSDFVAGLSNFGLGTSAVRNVAIASSTSNNLKVSVVVTVLRRLVWMTGFLGLLLTISFAPILSEVTFGNKEFTIAFYWISISLLFQQLSAGQFVVLQGLRKLKFLALANLLGSSIGLIISIPIYYLYRIDGIVPVIVISSLITLILSWIYAKKVNIKSVDVTLYQTITEGKEMLKMGFILSVSSLISLGTSYVVRIFISNLGGIAQVGLFSAGFAIINTYVGMVFRAMGTDYYPRLAEAANDLIKSRQLVNQQAEVAILILGPVLAIFLVFIKWIIVLFYSNKFLGINEMIFWAALGMFFKAASWSVAYLMLTLGKPQLFFWNELIASLYILLFNIAGYWFAGLDGLGISFLIGYIFYSIQVIMVAKIKFEFHFESKFIRFATTQLIICFLCFLTIKFFVFPWHYIFGLVLIFFSAYFSIRELNKMIDIKELFNKIMNHDKSSQ